MHYSGDRYLRLAFAFCGRLLFHLIVLRVANLYHGISSTMHSLQERNLMMKLYCKIYGNFTEAAREWPELFSTCHLPTPTPGWWRLLSLILKEWALLKMHLTVDGSSGSEERKSQILMLKKYIALPGAQAELRWSVFIIMFNY